MSYEGYENIYCINGHFITSRDAYDFSEEPTSCPVCKTDRLVFDCVDQTNGCWCPGEDQRDPDCPAHPIIEDDDIVGYTLVTCPKCSPEHSGFVKTVIYTGIQSFICPNAEKGDPVYTCSPECPECFGTSVVYMKDIPVEVMMVCPECNGRGEKPVPRFDVEKLRKAHEKMYEK